MNRKIFTATIVFATLPTIVGCGLGATAQNAALLAEHQKDISNQHIEMMDLKSSVVIMQNELDEVRGQFDELKSLDTRVLAEIEDMNNNFSGYFRVFRFLILSEERLLFLNRQYRIISDFPEVAPKRIGESNPFIFSIVFKFFLYGFRILQCFFMIS